MRRLGKSCFHAGFHVAISVSSLNRRNRAEDNEMEARKKESIFRFQTLPLTLFPCKDERLVRSGISFSSVLEVSILVGVLLSQTDLMIDTGLPT